MNSDPTRILLAVLAIGTGLALIVALLGEPEAAKYLLGALSIAIGAVIILGALDARKRERLG